MIDPTLIEGALILLGGAAGGWIARGRSARRATPAPVLPATCACGHVRSMHTEGKGACTETEIDFIWVGPMGGQTKVREELHCACKIYDGPEPLGSYYAPEISG